VIFKILEMIHVMIVEFNHQIVELTMDALRLIVLYIFNSLKLLIFG